MDRSSSRKHCSAGLRGAIIGQYQSGRTYSQISRSLNISTSTVGLWARRYVNEGHIGRMPNTGRPEKLPLQQQMNIVKAIEDQPFNTATSVAANFNVSRHTVSRIWAENGIFHFIPSLKQNLTDDHRVYRLAFAETHLARNTDWERIIFSDEKTFKSDSDKKLHLYRPRNQRFNEKYVQRGRRSGRISCGVWGWMSGGGVGELCEISGRLNSEGYTEILEEIMLPTVGIVYPGHNIHFMQDNCSIHSSNHSMEWFSRHPQIELLEWPANSPDLNPIENIWARMVYEWDSINPRTKPNLMNYVCQKWDELRGDRRLIENLIGSMPARLQAVVDNDGFWTKY